MYGEPLEPNKCLFDVEVDDGMFGNSGDIVLSLNDADDHGNDDIRDVNHPEFDEYWGNAMENVFISSKFASVEEAKQWCLNIGMVYNPEGVTNSCDSSESELF